MDMKFPSSTTFEVYVEENHGGNFSEYLVVHVAKLKGNVFAKQEMEWASDRTAQSVANAFWEWPDAAKKSLGGWQLILNKLSDL